jgi:N-acyl-D-amino-acid deacylase
MSDVDVVIRNGTVIDGTGAPGRVADVAVAGDRIAAIEPRLELSGTREIDADGRLVTPGFVDIHTHLDAQLAWDPLGTSSCWHGVTSVVLGNCGVTFAPVQPGDREYLAEMMESVEDIPRDAILEGLPWDWTGYDGYLRWLDRIPKGLNVGGMVGHCAVRYAAMGTRSLDETPATAADIARMCELVDEAMAGGALGFSTSRTLLHRVPDGRPVPGTFADTDELFAIADVLGRHRAGVFEAAARLGERDGADLVNTRAEVGWMGELSRRSGRPVSFGLTQSDRRPDLYARVVQFAKEENAKPGGALVRPQTTARGVGVLFGLHHRTPWDNLESWRVLRTMSLAGRLAHIRNPEARAAMVADATAAGDRLDPTKVWAMIGPGATYDCAETDTLAAHAARRGVSPAEAFLQLSDESHGTMVLNFPFLNQRLSAVVDMLRDPLVTLGLADAGAHVGQIMDASQPSFFLSYWIRDRQLLTIEDAIRRLTTDTARLFGIADRGVLAPGAYADVNVIDLDAITVPMPEYVHDFPGGAGRYVQRGTGYDLTMVNGTVLMEHGRHQGAYPGRLVTSN